MQPTISNYTVLFTNQKHKKFKTWQDGTMKYYSINKKLVLVDEKGYTIDSKFFKGEAPEEDTEIDFERYIVRVESVVGDEPHIIATAQMPTRAPPSIHRSSRRTEDKESHQETTTTNLFHHNHRQARLDLIRMNEHHHDSTPTTTTTPLSLNRPHHAPYKNTHDRSPVYRQNDAQPSTSNYSHTTRTNSNTSQTNMYTIDNGPGEGAIEEMNDKHSEQTDTRHNTNLVYDSITAHHNTDADCQITHINTGSNPQNMAEENRSKRLRVGLSKNHLRPPLHKNVSASPIQTPSTSRNPIYKERVLPPSVTSQQSPTPPNAAMPAKTHSLVADEIRHRLKKTPEPEKLFIKASELPMNEPTDVVGESSNSSFSIQPRDVLQPFKSPATDRIQISTILQFPNIEKSLAVLRNKKHTKRSRTVPASFKSMADYKEVFQKLIYEHLQILLLNYAIYYFSFYNNAGKNENLERYFRMKGCGFYTGCDLKEDSRQGTHDRFRIMLRNKEHHSKYNKDDIWVISKSPKFDASITFLSRSVYHGPFADGGIEIECLSPRDIRVAYNILKGDSSVYALRTITANGEFMMLDNLKEGIERTPLFPYMLKDNKQKRKLAEIMPRLELEHIRLSLEDGINVEEKIKSTIEMYHLNTDQSSVLRTVAKSVITCPGWNEESENPIILVHGVFGSGKSYLAAVIIIFIRDIIDTVCDTREPENQISFRILVSSMTNVAVDRILLTLLKLGYDHFVRVGSLKKIKKTLLPYTAQAKLTSNDELKELEQMLADPQNTEEEIECIASTLQRFRKREHLRQIESSQVVGTTCMASVFEVFNGIRFPLVLMDECSQLMEPLNMVPLSRFSCNRLIMIGDPMQLPPTLTTNAEEETVGQGLDKTLFDRMTEMGHHSTMLRTQYRCHPEISNVSNRLFYSQRLVNGVTAEERKPFIQGLPNLIFVNVGGEEHRNIQSNSFWNETEVKASANIINSLLRLGAVSEDMGVIALYKQQADRLVKHLAATSENVNNNIHISTVDSFQGGEKEIIILSTVRTSSSGFIDSETRVNVALSRAKRHLIILGNRDLLNSNDLWFRILCACQDNSYSIVEFEKILNELG